MIDVLLFYPDRDAAMADLSDYAISYGGVTLPLWPEPGVIQGAFAFEPRVYVLTGNVVTHTDEETGATIEEPERSYLAWHYVWLTLPERDPDLEARASFGLCADRQAFEAGEPDFVRAAGFTPEQLGASYIEPILFGTRYPFGTSV